jgi:hypothetical protein
MLIPFLGVAQAHFSLGSPGGSLGDISIGIDDIRPKEIVGQDTRPDDG